MRHDWIFQYIDPKNMSLLTGTIQTNTGSWQDSIRTTKVFAIPPNDHLATPVPEKVEDIYSHNILIIKD